MAIVKCPDCGKMISDRAPACIGCGRPLTESWRESPEPAERMLAALPRFSKSTAFPDPPNLHWVIVGLLSVVTINIFIPLWLLRQSVYAKKLDSKSRAFTWAVLSILLTIACAGTLPLLEEQNGKASPVLLEVMFLLFLVFAVIFHYMGIFSLRATLLRHFNTVENVGLELGGFMTYIYGPIFFQYHLRRIWAWRKTGVIPRDKSKRRAKDKSSSHSSRIPGLVLAVVALIVVTIGAVYYGLNRVKPDPFERTVKIEREIEAQPAPTPKFFTTGPLAGLEVEVQPQISKPAYTEADFLPSPSKVQAPDYSGPERKTEVLPQDPQTQFTIGMKYRNGEGVPQNYAEAAGWFVLAGDQGHALAQFNLALMYLKGEGVPQNNAEVVKWYRRAANRGFARAQYNLGVMYHKGEGVPQNYYEAEKLFRLAADQGNVDAQYNLGFMYAAGGVGISKNHTEAMKWMRLAAAQGDAEAQAFINEY